MMLLPCSKTGRVPGRRETIHDPQRIVAGRDVAGHDPFDPSRRPTVEAEHASDGVILVAIVHQRQYLISPPLAKVAENGEPLAGFDDAVARRDATRRVFAARRVHPAGPDLLVASASGPP